MRAPASGKTSEVLTEGGQVGFGAFDSEEESGHEPENADVGAGEFVDAFEGADGDDGDGPKEDAEDGLSLFFQD